jgi:hypothetical protein
MNRGNYRANRTPNRSALLLVGAALLCAGMTPAIAVRTLTGGKFADGAEARVMQGFPSPDDELATRGNSLRHPYLRWSLRNTRMLIPTAGVERAAEPLPLPGGPKLDPDAVQFMIDGTTLTLADWLRRTRTDGCMVVHSVTRSAARTCSSKAAPGMRSAGLNCSSQSSG